MNTEKIKEYFAANTACLNVSGIEVKAGLPPKTLDHFLKGRRNLPKNAEEKILNIIKSLTYQ